MNATASGWPFLIARGRRRGYTVLLAPDFLIDERDYGILEQTAGPVTGPFRIASVISTLGHRLCLVWSEYTVTAADLAGGSPRDEHSRPLRLLNGFCTREPVSAPAGTDLTHAHGAALDTYRRFLDDEEHFVVEPSNAFPTDSALAPAPSGRPEVAARAQPPQPPSPLRRWAVPATLAGLAAGVTLVTVIALSPSGTSAPPPSSPTSTPPPTSASTTKPTGTSGLPSKNVPDRRGGNGRGVGP
jgi:hypothetical protein